MTKKTKESDALNELLAAASHKVLSELILELTNEIPNVRRKCFDFLKSHVAVSKTLSKRSEGEAVLALWSELAPDLEELDMYGGGDYATQDLVAELLEQIRKRLESKAVDADHRRELLDLVLPFIKSGNAGLDDMLDDVAHAACYDDGDLRRLAQAYETMTNEWKTGLARAIYRRLGDRDKYLELRAARMTYGADYHDLATFYWEAGEKEKGLQVAEEGLRKAKGRMDELRGFVAARARDAGDRDIYMALQLNQTTDGLTLEKYMAFKQLCSADEWRLFEPKIVLQLKRAGRSERLKIHMHRREYDQAVALLSKGRYPMSAWDGNYEVQMAKELEKDYPEEILKYYLSGLGHLDRNDQRKEYARKAKVMAKVRHVLVEVLDDKPRWEKFARKVKQDNLRRSAFQQEFAAAVPGWRELNGPG